MHHGLPEDDPFAEDGGIDWGSLNDDLLNSSMSSNTSAQPADILQRLLDGVATPAEMRAAESSLTVPESVLKQAGLDFLNETPEIQESTIWYDPALGTIADESFVSFSADNIFNSTMVQLDDNHCPQILRGNDTPDPELQDSLESPPLPTSSPDIVQQAMNSINDIDMEAGSEPAGANASDMPPPTPDLTGQSNVHNTSHFSNSSRGTKRTRGASSSRGRSSSRGKNKTNSTRQPPKPSSSRSNTSAAKRPRGATSSDTSSAVEDLSDGDQDASRHPSGRRDPSPRPSTSKSSTNHTSTPPGDDSDDGFKKPPPPRGKGARAKNTPKPAVPTLPGLQTLQDYTPSFPQSRLRHEAQRSLQQEISDLVSNARQLAPLPIPGANLGNNDTGVIVYENAPIAQAAPRTALALTPDLDGSFSVKIPDFPGHPEVKQVDVNVNSSGAVTFMLMCRRPSDSGWSFPPKQIFYDFVVLLEQQLWSSEFEDLILWHNLWGVISLIGIQAANLDRLDRFRVLIMSKLYHGLIFATFPRESVDRWTELNIILKSHLRAFDISKLTDAVLKYNSHLGLRGRLQLSKSFDYPSTQTSKKGESKEGWRHAIVLGDSVFMDSIKPFAQSHPFRIGSSSVQIRGGERKKEEKPTKPVSSTSNPSSKRTSTTTTSRRPRPLAVASSAAALAPAAADQSTRTDENTDPNFPPLATAVFQRGKSVLTNNPVSNTNTATKSFSEEAIKKLSKNTRKISTNFR